MTSFSADPRYGGARRDRRRFPGRFPRRAHPDEKV